MGKNPLILEVKGNSLDDGPGIRTVVFFKGCPLSCLWCHNPESKKAVQEIGFDAEACAGCDACLEICPENALSRENRFFIDRERCTLCFACADHCPSGALSRVGRESTVEEIMALVLQDKPFFDASGGGVTLSGGEPTLYTAFASRLLQALKAEGVHTLIETCGDFDFSLFRRSILPWVDAVYFDLKLMDPQAHRRFCGKTNERILKNFEKLTQAVRDGSVSLLPRAPLIPEITTPESNLLAMAGFLASTGMREARLMPYNPLWFNKCEKIGEASPFRNETQMRAWLSPERIAVCEAIFRTFGVDAHP